MVSSNLAVHRIRPDQPLEVEYPLSLVDGVMPRINSRYLFVYDTRKTSASQLVSARTDLVRRLKDGLQCMLRQPEEGILALPELMGKIYENPVDGKLNLKITKSSWVNLVVSYRDDITLESLKPEEGYPRQGFTPAIFCAADTEAVAFPTATEGCASFAPQVTFIKGGYVVMVNKHHSLLDATGSSRLVKWWFANARNISSHSSPPISASDCLAIHDRRPLLPPPSEPTQDHSATWKPTPGAAPTIFGLTLPPMWVLTILKILPFKLLPEASSHIFFFSSSSLNRLKKATEAHTTSRFSTNDALVALVWTSIMHARAQSESASKPSSSTQDPLDPSCLTTSVSMSVNMRGRLSPPLPESYFGNAVSVVTTPFLKSQLLSGTPSALADTTLQVRSSLTQKATNEYSRSYINLISSQQKVSDCKMILRLASNDVYMNSWETLYGNMDELDLGFGEFQRVRLPMANPFPGFANVLPAYGCRDRDATGGDGGVRYQGGLEVMIDLSGEDMRRLRKDEGFMQYVDKVY